MSELHRKSQISLKTTPWCRLSYCRYTLSTLYLGQDVRSLLFPKLSTSFTALSHWVCLYKTSARAARPEDSMPPWAPGTALRRCVTLLVYSVYLFHPHTFLVCSEDAMNGSAAGSVQCGCVQCSTHPNLHVVLNVSHFHQHCLQVCDWSAGSAHKGKGAWVTLQSVKKLFQKTMKIFSIYSSSHECWCFSVLYFTIRFHQVFSAFPCHPGDSSAWTCTQRKNIATCNSQ